MKCECVSSTPPLDPLTFLLHPLSFPSLPFLSFPPLPSPPLPSPPSSSPPPPPTPSQAIAACLTTFVVDSCGAKVVNAPPMDKIQTFSRGDVVQKKSRGGRKKVCCCTTIIYNTYKYSSVFLKFYLFCLLCKVFCHFRLFHSHTYFMYCMYMHTCI